VPVVQTQVLVTPRTVPPLMMARVPTPLQPTLTVRAIALTMLTQTEFATRMKLMAVLMRKRVTIVQQRRTMMGPVPSLLATPTIPLTATATV